MSLITKEFAEYIESLKVYYPDAKDQLLRKQVQRSDLNKKKEELLDLEKYLGLLARAHIFTLATSASVIKNQLEAVQTLRQKVIEEETDLKMAVEKLDVIVAAIAAFDKLEKFVKN
jgi:hypothetical protein